MNADRELSEYRALCAALKNLREKFLRRRQEVIKLLEETSSRRKEVLFVLAKANRLTRHLTGRQRQMAGITYHIGEISARINQAGTPVFRGNLGEPETSIEIREECRSLVELKRLGFAVIGMIDSIKKKLLQLDLLEMRCRELILSINKSLEAFRHEFAVIYQKIYPFGVFSFFRRSIRRFLGKTYFTFRDMGDITALGKITGLVLKIADSPVI